MKHLRIILPVLFVLVGFFSYGTGRTLYTDMHGSIGFSIGSVLSGVVVSGFIFALTFVFIFPAFYFSGVKLNMHLVLIHLVRLCASLFIGAFLAEVLILNDELEFVLHTESLGRFEEKGSFSRQRWWPHSNGSLMWSRDRGYWSTD